MENKSENKNNNVSSSNPIGKAKIVLEDDYLLPYYHIFTNEGVSDSDIYNRLVSVLNKRVGEGNIIDLDSMPDTLRINCQYYNESGSQYIPFIVRVFKHKGKSVFEFQRRSGDASLFHKLFASCVNDMCDMGIVSKKILIREEPNYNNFEDFESNVSKKDIEHTVKCLLRMLRSKFVDVKANALEGIVSLSMSQTYKEVMVQMNYVQELVKCLSVPFEDIQRMSLSGLKHLTGIEKGKALFLTQKGALDLLKQMKQKTKTKQVVREIDAILNNVM
jgi:hypothetical protein